MEIKEVEIEGEKIFLKKDWTGWRVVEPFIFKDPTTGVYDWKTFNWKNFLSKKGFITLAYVLFLLLVLFLAFREQLANYNNVMENPCQFCKTCQDSCRELISGIKPITTQKINWDINFNGT